MPSHKDDSITCKLQRLMLPLTCNRSTRHQPHWCIQGKADSKIMQTLKLHLCAEKKKFLSHHMLDTCVFSPFWRVSESISVAKNVPFSSQVPVTQYCLHDTDFLIEAEIIPDQTPKIKKYCNKSPGSGSHSGCWNYERFVR